mgnify:CR=1 FL=1
MVDEALESFERQGEWALVNTVNQAAGRWDAALKVRSNDSVMMNVDNDDEC